MCGICGYIDFAKREGAAAMRARVLAMSGTLRRRGPDGEAAWTDEAAGVALAHRRLAIIDLSPAGRQPMVSGDGRYVVTYNGEIYNFAALRAELESGGHRFVSRSDTEVLLEACAAWGAEAAARRLIGIFAFALWDRAERSLTLVRDQIGVKPLYWTLQGRLLLFGSELKALRAHPGWQAELDPDALATYFRYGYVPAQDTIYRNVHKLPPGHLLVLRDDGETPVPTPFWDARSLARDGMAAPSASSDDETVDDLDRLLREAVASQMVADVPLGAFLSGGIDSSAVVAAMQAQSSRPVKTFTVGFRESGYDEAQFAAPVAKHLGTEHTEILLDPATAAGIIPDLAEWFDEPFADSSQIPTFLVSRLARQHVTVSLSGDGGDELFAGYNRYLWGDTIRRSLALVPGPLRRSLAGAATMLPAERWNGLFRALPARLRPERGGDKIHKLAQVLGHSDENAVYRRLVTQWEPGAIVRAGAERPGILADRELPREFPRFIERMQLVDLVTYLPDDILVKLDRTSMAVSLEARVPLLDPRLVAFAWRLPRAMKLRRGTGKWALRQVLYRYLPRELVDRPKMGFGVPIGGWLRGKLRDWAEDLLEERELAADGLLDPQPIRALWADHCAGRRDAQYPLWTVLMFQAWKRRWLDGACAPRSSEAEPLDRRAS
jgi:asparagine synthase (glutamine-hydrolysing)